jgi:hypothetical protein
MVYLARIWQPRDAVTALLPTAWQGMHDCYPGLLCLQGKKNPPALRQRVKSNS